MEEEIILLQDFINGKIQQDKLENYKGGYKLGFFYTKDLQKAIENLIARNKELESDLYEANQIISEQIDIIANSVSKDEIKEILLNKIRYRQFELQQEYKYFKDDIELNTLQDVLELLNKGE